MTEVTEPKVDVKMEPVDGEVLLKENADEVEGIAAAAEPATATVDTERADANIKVSELDAGMDGNDGPHEDASDTATAPTTSKAFIHRAPSHLSLSTISHYPQHQAYDTKGVLYELYRGEFTSLPDFTSLTPFKAGIIPSISLSHFISPQSTSTLPQDFAIRFRTHLHIPHAGTWTFYLSSADGSSLFISGKNVISNDGCHYVLEKEGSIKIGQPDYYPVTVTYFYKRGKMMEGLRTGREVKLMWYFPGTGWWKDRVTKSEVSDGFWVGPRELAVVRECGEGEMGGEHEGHDGEERRLGDGEMRVHGLEQELREMANRLVMVQTALDKERRLFSNVLRRIKDVPYFRNGQQQLKIEQISGDNASPQSTANHEENGYGYDFEQEGFADEVDQMVTTHLSQIDRLQTAYFFSLGVYLKTFARSPNLLAPRTPPPKTKARSNTFPRNGAEQMRPSVGSNVSLQEAYEHVREMRMGVDEWPRFLRKVVEGEIELSNGGVITGGEPDKGAPASVVASASATHAKADAVKMAPKETSKSGIGKKLGSVKGKMPLRDDGMTW